MNKHEEAINFLSIITENILEMSTILNDNTAENWNDNQKEIEALDTYIHQSEATEQAYDELKKDVAEFLKLYHDDIRSLNIDRNRFSELKHKLSQLGDTK